MTSKLITLPNSTLRRPSQKIRVIDSKIKTLNQEMIDQALLWEKGRKYEATVGLAAVQINQPLRIIIIRQENEQDAPPTFHTFINPKIIQTKGPKIQQLEGCLSVPKYYTNVERYQKVKISALDLEGQIVRFKAEDFLARILQHEIDHLEGIMTVDRAVETTNQDGEIYKFCCLDPNGHFIIADNQEIKQAKLF